MTHRGDLGLLRYARALCALACIGCASDDANDTGSGAGETDSGNPDGARTLMGNFTVNLVPARDATPAFSSLLGKIADGPQPPPVPFVLDSEQGECRLLVPAHPFCDPACRGGACNAENECTPFPTPQDVGTVRVQGLGDAELVLQPIGSAFTYQTRDALPHPPCEEGAVVRVEADAFSMQTRCITPLEVTGPDPIPVRAGESIPLTWTPAGQAVGSQIHITLDISHHGGQKGEIDCEVPDTGTFVVPEPLVTKLVNLGVAGFPTIELSRVATGAAQDHPDVRVQLSSAITRDVDTGVTSCMEDTDCPAGMTCRSENLICEE